VRANTITLIFMGPCFCVITWALTDNSSTSYDSLRSRYIYTYICGYMQLKLVEIDVTDAV